MPEKTAVQDALAVAETRDAVTAVKTEWEITHDLQTTDVLVQVIEVATNDIVGASVTIKGDSYITIKMEDIQLGANYKVIVIG